MKQILFYFAFILCPALCWGQSAPVITTPGGILPSSTLDAAYSLQLEATGYPVNWAVTSGELPGGLLINPETGLIFGISWTLGTFNFIVTVTGNDGLSAQADYSITVNPANANVPVITITKQPDSVVITHGATTGSVSVEATVTQGATLSYQWYILGLNGYYETLHGATSATCTIPENFVPRYHYFICVVSASGGAASVLSRFAEVTIHPAGAPVITVTKQPVDVTVTEGAITGNLSVEATVTQGATLTYQWYLTGPYNYGPVSGGDLPTVPIPADLVPDSIYYYYCLISTEGALSVASRSVRVTVLPPAPSRPPSSDIRNPSEIVVSETSLIFMEDGGRQSISVRYGGEWEAVCDREWVGITIGISKNAGSTVIVTVKPNTDFSPRRATVTVKSKTVKGVSQKITVVQSAGGRVRILSAPTSDGDSPVATPLSATATGVTGDDAMTSPSLKAYAQGGTLYVSGLTAGRPLSVYSISGTLIYQTASPMGGVGGGFSLPLPGRGIYIVTDGTASVKAVY